MIIKIEKSIILFFYCFKGLVERARSLGQIFTNDVSSKSSKFNREICTQYDNIVRNITRQSVTVSELVKQIDYVDGLRVGELLQLRVRCLIFFFVREIEV